MTAKGSRHAFGMAKARVRSVPTGVCMSTPLRTGAALDMMHFDGQEMRTGAVCCEHVLSAKGSREAFRGQSRKLCAECFWHV